MIQWWLTTHEGWALPPWGIVAIVVVCLLCVYPAWAKGGR